MLGFKRRLVSLQQDPLLMAIARLDSLQRELAATPTDRACREQFRLAHNAIAELTGRAQPTKVSAA